MSDFYSILGFASHLQVKLSKVKGNFYLENSFLTNHLRMGRELEKKRQISLIRD